MDWTEITILTTTAGADMVSELLMDAGSLGTMIEDKNDVRANQRPEGRWDILGEELARRMGDDVRVTGYYEKDDALGEKIRAITEGITRMKAMDLGFDAGKLAIEQSELIQKDWAEEWKKAFGIIRLGEHFVVRPGWIDYAPEAGEKLITIDPGMAFGTGTHETTGMCCELIEKYVAPGMRVIDIGTGSGILAIAAAHMGAGDVLAIDIDEVAVRTAIENVAINGFEGSIRCVAGDLLQNVDEQAEVIIANIIADAVKMLAEPVKPHFAPGGRFICSGIAIERKQEVLDALHAANYTITDLMERGEWCAISALPPQ